eukprot:6490836-Amphidinium_carterae.1
MLQAAGYYWLPVTARDEDGRGTAKSGGMCGSFSACSCAFVVECCLRRPCVCFKVFAHVAVCQKCTFGGSIAWSGSELVGCDDTSYDGRFCVLVSNSTENGDKGDWSAGGTDAHGLEVAKVKADGRCMYRSIAVGQGLDEGRWREVVIDLLAHMQSNRWQGGMSTEIANHAIVCARMALRHGRLAPTFWPTEPHLHAYAQAKGVYLRVWNEKADRGKQWHAYGDEGTCISITYNGVDHYDALIRESKRAADRAEGGTRVEDKNPRTNAAKQRWCLVTINVSSWKQAVLYLDYIRSGEAGYEPDVIFMQEHRMEGRDGEAIVTGQLQRSGYRVAFQSARRADRSGRACAGTLIAVKARYGIRCEDNEHTGHRMASCVLNGIAPGGVRLMSLYQEVGTAAEERRSEQLQRCLQSAVEDVRPFIIGADFNEDATGVMGGLPQSHQWSIWKGNQPTCIGCGVSEIDYYIGHRSLAQLWIGTQVDMLAPTSPHRPVVAWLNGTGTSERISVLREHGKFPLLRPVGCVTYQYARWLDGLAGRDLDELWLEWNDGAEKQLCAMHDVDQKLMKRYRGNGRGPAFVQKTHREIWAKEHEMRFPAVIRWLRMLQQFIRLQERRRWSRKGVLAWKARLPLEAMS